MSVILAFRVLLTTIGIINGGGGGFVIFTVTFTYAGGSGSGAVKMMV